MEANIQFTKQDKQLLDNLIKILTRAEIKLVGVEIIAAGDSMRFLSRLQRQIEDYKEPEMALSEVKFDKSIKTKSK